MAADAYQLKWSHQHLLGDTVRWQAVSAVGSGVACCLAVVTVNVQVVSQLRQPCNTTRRCQGSSAAGAGAGRVPPAASAQVEIKTTQQTTNPDVLQKAADFVHAYILGEDQQRLQVSAYISAGRATAVAQLTNAGCSSCC
jgi:hypothetical protein